LSRKVVTRGVVCPRCWLSYTGTVAGSLRSLGVDCDTVDVGGYSGYAFIVNVTKGATDPSGPTALGDLWNEIFSGTESLGLSIEVYQDVEYERLSGDPTPEELERTRGLFERVKGEIDGRDRPVVVWGLPAPDFGVAVGYEEESYLANTVYGDTEIPVPYYRLQAPGKIQALFFRDEVERQTAFDVKAVERAVRFASWTAPAPGGSLWVMGPPALGTWADALRKLPETQDYWSGYGGNSYVAQCVREGRSLAAEFLNRLSAKHRGRQAKHLKEASKSYEEERKLMEGFTQIFPYTEAASPQPELKPEHLKKGAEILRKVKLLEEKAARDMRKALEEWESL